jgi:hypothetical protein
MMLQETLPRTPRPSLRRPKPSEEPTGGGFTPAVKNLEKIKYTPGSHRKAHRHELILREKRFAAERKRQRRLRGKVFLKKIFWPALPWPARTALKWIIVVGLILVASSLFKNDYPLIEEFLTRLAVVAFGVVLVAVALIPAWPSLFWKKLATGVFVLMTIPLTWMASSEFVFEKPQAVDELPETTATVIPYVLHRTDDVLDSAFQKMANVFN